MKGPWKSVSPATNVLHLGHELTLASSNEITGCLCQSDHILFTTILSALEKNSGGLLKSLKCISKGKV